ncbi:hypothetical protein EJ06DRAFT_471261, partial [Trichodelitschia bisporula]
MSRHGGFRRSEGNLSIPPYDDVPPRGDLPPRGPPSRWDRDKFERESVRIDDTRGPAGHRRDVIFDERTESRGPRGRVDEQQHYYERDRFGPTPSEVASRALAPYRRRASVVERDFEYIDREVAAPPKRPARPQFIRRQSSLDTFDRRPLRR